VISAWVLFRAESFEQATGLLRSMWWPTEIVFPSAVDAAARFGSALGLGWRSDSLPYLFGAGQIALLLIGFALVFFGRGDERVGVIKSSSGVRSLDFGAVGEPLLYASLFMFCLWRLTAGGSVFIYYQF
jgi:hypothetical protein